MTIRMHYANCNSYNADFDGDEMNMLIRSSLNDCVCGAETHHRDGRKVLTVPPAIHKPKPLWTGKQI
ncbi:4611_t:CDS:2, partial [Funneliformis geosporum]